MGVYSLHNKYSEKHIHMIRSFFGKYSKYTFITLPKELSFHSVVIQVPRDQICIILHNTFLELFLVNRFFKNKSICKSDKYFSHYKSDLRLHKIDLKTLIIKSTI